LTSLNFGLKENCLLVGHFSYKSTKLGAKSLHFAEMWLKIINEFVYTFGSEVRQIWLGTLVARISFYAKSCRNREYIVRLQVVSRSDHRQCLVVLHVNHHIIVHGQPRSLPDHRADVDAH